MERDGGPRPIVRKIVMTKYEREVLHAATSPFFQPTASGG
jgi:hypothetical protein